SLYYTDELNMRETAEIMGITEGRVSQLHSQALGRLRKEFASLYGDSAEM
ncbi:MAG: sigma factor-like helix-turn-helix DNA-binding protein, partial [Desulfovibrio fairfieldensis]|nr:sigma factor-like helix-turn-helix DNA-binding protein [Desulfovibrio fairfieldensis]